MRRKAELAMKEGVHIMIWELGQDVGPPSHESGLLAAIGRALRSDSSDSNDSSGDKDAGKIEL